MTRTLRRRLLLVSVITLAWGVLAAPALASVTYSDYRQSSDASIFYKHTYDDGFTHSTSGGYVNTATNWECKGTHGWSGCTRSTPDDYANWFTYKTGSYNFSQWQAYITTSGTDTRADYTATGDAIVNQYTVHGWTTVLNDDYCPGHVRLDDYHDGVGWWSGQQADWDAVRLYY